MRQGFLRGGNHLPDKHEGFEHAPRGPEGTPHSSSLTNPAKLPPPQLIPPLEYSTLVPTPRPHWFQCSLQSPPMGAPCLPLPCFIPVLHHLPEFFYNKIRASPHLNPEEVPQSSEASTVR